MNTLTFSTLLKKEIDVTATLTGEHIHDNLTRTIIDKQLLKMINIINDFESESESNDLAVAAAAADSAAYAAAAYAIEAAKNYLKSPDSDSAVDDLKNDGLCRTLKLTVIPI